jgi:hypothetical protein
LGRVLPRRFSSIRKQLPQLKEADLEVNEVKWSGHGSLLTRKPRSTTDCARRPRGSQIVTQRKCAWRNHAWLRSIPLDGARQALLAVGEGVVAVEEAFYLSHERTRATPENRSRAPRENRGEPGRSTKRVRSLSPPAAPAPRTQLRPYAFDAFPAAARLGELAKAGSDEEGPDFEYEHLNVLARVLSEYEWRGPKVYAEQAEVTRKQLEE